MNREIKFRAWDSKYMRDASYGDWVSFDGATYTEADLKYNTPHIEIEKSKNYTLMQYIGLKDNEGKEIYEGDIIQHNGKKFVCNWSKIFGHCFVEINKNLGTFHLDGIVMTNHNRRKQSEIVNYIKYVEVIGNIYENPELLKQ